MGLGRRRKGGRIAGSSGIHCCLYLQPSPAWEHRPPSRPSGDWGGGPYSDIQWEGLSASDPYEAIPGFCRTPKLICKCPCGRYWGHCRDDISLGTPGGCCQPSPGGWQGMWNPWSHLGIRQYQGGQARNTISGDSSGEPGLGEGQDPWRGENRERQYWN